MSELDKGYPNNRAETSHAEVRSMPYFPGSPPATAMQMGTTPLPSPVPQQAGRHAGGDGPPPPVHGRIVIEDEVVQKIASMAAMEVGGVAGLLSRADETHQGVRVSLRDSDVSLDLRLAVEYGCVVMDVAKIVKANVARVVGLMLGVRIVAVDVAIEDVWMPREAEALS
ncbi:Asp23/Gls24 family envelope stress response protein [Spirillospora sp. CA-294931]|uniref:Asp23/Gls24 family envelope stress response protein n=1 Tax=Spirillospora sp. CA-294931 TaxID=3240042 RepID=UPI003D92FE85